MGVEGTKTIFLNFSHCDVSGRWKYASILTEMQELGEIHAAELGFSRNSLVQNGMCWVLYMQKLQMEVHPVMGDEVRMITWPAALKGLFFPRYFRFERPDGSLLGEASTAWVLFSLENRKLLRPSALGGAVPANEERESSLGLPGALRVEGAEAAGARRVQYSDLDVNGHMNNARYAEWVIDLLAADRLTALGLKSLQINYNTEGRLGDEVTLSLLREPQRTLVLGQKGPEKKRMFEAEAVFN